MAQAGEMERGRWPPDALPNLAPGIAAKVRFAWLGLFLLVAAIQLAGFGFVLFDSYRVNPAFYAVGISTEFDDEDRVVVEPLRADVTAAGVVAGARIASIAGRRFGADASSLSLARTLMAAPGDTVPIGFRNPDGREMKVHISRSSRARAVATPIPMSVNLRMVIRLFFTLLCSAALLGSSIVLLLRRPGDPLAILFGFGFLGIAASVDPPLLMWLSIGAGWVIDIVTGVWWTLLVIALASFPNGSFTPPWLRWSLVAAPLLGLALALDRLGDVSSLLVGICVPLMLIAAQVMRYRRLRPGPERQQIKWAAFGFAAGFVLVGVALGLSLAPYDDWPAAVRGAWLLVTVCLFNLGFAVMPLGLLVSLIRYRLWDVDRIISRSVAYTLLTGGIGLFWAILSELTKQIVATLLGPGHVTLALAIGAMVAVGVFAPTQRLTLKWSKRRFNPTRLDLEQLPKRLRVWRERCDVPQVAARALDVALRALHAPAGAILARTPTGRALLASRNVAENEAVTPAKTPGGFVLHLEDEDGLAGWLVLSPREDGSRFSRSDLAALGAVAGPLAAALRIAAPAAPRETAVLNMLDEVQQRLAKLEQKEVRPT